MKNPFSRALGYLAEGVTGLCGLEGAKVAAPSVAHTLLFQAAPTHISMEQVQAIVSILMQVAVGVVTLWRMIKPKKALLIPTDPAAIVPPLEPTTPPAAFPPPTVNP